MIKAWLATVVLSSSIAGVAAAEPSAKEAWKEVDALLASADRALVEDRDGEAEAGYRRALELAPRFGSTSLFTARALDGLGDVQRRAGRWSEARGSYARAAELWLALLGEQQPRRATTLHHLGLACAALGDREQARGHLRLALEIWEARLGADSMEAESTRRALDALGPE